MSKQFLNWLTPDKKTDQNGFQKMIKKNSKNMRFYILSRMQIMHTRS